MVFSPTFGQVLSNTNVTLTVAEGVKVDITNVSSWHVSSPYVGPISFLLLYELLRIV